MIELLAPASIGSLYERAIVDTGREPEFLFLLSFLLSFGFIRTSAHLIRAQVRWWPGNVNVGGTHVHHLVWGICTILVTGYIGLVVSPPSPWHELLIVAFGIGTGLTLDEFALWLHLRDVYWEKQGRASIDAVIIAAALSGLGVIGFSAWLDVAKEVERAVAGAVGAVGLLAIVLALINAAKERFLYAIASLLIPAVGLIGALRLAKPTSLWAHHLYGPKKMERARRRFGVEPESGEREATGSAS